MLRARGGDIIWVLYEHYPSHLHGKTEEKRNEKKSLAVLFLACLQCPDQAIWNLSDSPVMTLQHASEPVMLVVM